MSRRRSVFDHSLEVWSRLADHRPFLRCEIKSFLHDFELKHPDQQLPDLLAPLQQLDEVRSVQLEQCRTVLQEILPDIRDSTQRLHQQCTTILENSGKNPQLQDWTAELQIGREQEWGEFLNSLQQQRAEIDQEFLSKEADLEEYYKRAEAKKHFQ